MIPRMTTVGTLKNYRYDLNRSNNTMGKAMDTVITRRTFNSYAEDPAMATRCFQLRRSYQRAAGQLTINDSLRHKYDVAWSALDESSQDIYAIADDTTFGSLIRSLNGATASARNALGQSMSAKAKSIVQTMNCRYGENYVFSGADTLNVPFTWEARKNPDYIAPEVADPANEEHAAVFEYMLSPTDPDYAEGARYTNDEARAAVDGNGDPVKNDKYNSDRTFRYLKEDGTVTDSQGSAQSVLCFRGVPVDANPDTEDGKRLAYFLGGETKDLDVGLGHKEKNGEAVDSTVFNSALQGVYYLGGTGTSKVTVTVGEGTGAREVTKEVPNNIVSIIARMGEILQRCSNEDGSYTDEDEEEFVALAHQFEDQKDLYIQRYAEMDTQTGFLRDNSELLTNTADSLSQQFMALEDVDPAAAISSYMFARYCYDAALKVGNSVLSQSLMDYMNF